MRCGGRCSLSLTLSNTILAIFYDYNTRTQRSHTIRLPVWIPSVADALGGLEAKAQRRGVRDPLTLPFQDAPNPDCYIELALRSERDPTGFVPTCSVFRCMQSPTIFCMPTTEHDEWYPRGPPRWVPFSTQVSLWPRRWFLDTFGSIAEIAFGTAPTNSTWWAWGAKSAAESVIANRKTAHRLLEGDPFIS